VLKIVVGTRQALARDGDVGTLPEDLSRLDLGVGREPRAGAAARLQAELGEEVEHVVRAGAACEEAAAGGGVGAALRAGGPGVHGVEERERVEHAQLVAAEERGGAALERGGAVKVVRHPARGAEHVEVRRKEPEDEVDAGLGVRVALRDAGPDALEVPGRRGRAPEVSVQLIGVHLCSGGVGGGGGGGVPGVLGAHEGGCCAAGRGEEAAGLLAGDERADGVAQVGVGEEAQERGHGCLAGRR
jgi:hypothetical protein